MRKMIITDKIFNMKKRKLILFCLVGAILGLSLHAEINRNGHISSVYTAYCWKDTLPGSASDGVFVCSKTGCEWTEGLIGDGTHGCDIQE